MDTVIVQRIAGDGSRTVPVGLAPGQALTFGRGALSEPVDVCLPHPEVSRLAGEITAVDDHWTVSNLSGHLTYVVENPEGGGEHIKIAPRRIGAPVPFELARLILPISTGREEILVFAPQHTFADAVNPMQDGQVTLSGFSLDQTAKYFAILVALCEPRLRDASTSALPTIAQIIERLAPLPECATLSRSGVNFHIDYLAHSKLRLREFAGDDRSRVEYKRAALVSFAIRFDLVREEHLALLPPLRERGPRIG